MLKVKSAFSIFLAFRTFDREYRDPMHHYQGIKKLFSRLELFFLAVQGES